MVLAFNLDFLAANETPPTHNNRSRGAGGVRYHCGLLETSTSKGWRGQNREEEEKYATIGNLDCYRKNLGLSYEAWMGETPLDEVVLVSNPEIVDLLRKHGGKTAEELKAESK